jgi:ferredoxin
VEFLTIGVIVLKKVWIPQNTPTLGHKTKPSPTGCRACIDVCPCGALTDDGYDADRCREYRDKPDIQKRASTHTVMKCMRCMTVCDKKRIKELLK